MRLSLNKIREISENIQLGRENEFCNFLNEFPGSNIYYKFENIIKAWEYYINDYISFNIDGETVKVPIYFFLNQLSKVNKDKTVVDRGDIKLVLQIPEMFSQSDDMILFIESINELMLSGISLNFDNLSSFEKKTIIERLPAKIFCIISGELIKDKSKSFSIENDKLAKFNLNFYTEGPYIFLKSLFSNFTKEYFQDIIFHLSKRLSGDVLMDASIKDIEFYIKKYNEELEVSGNGIVL